MTTAQVKRYTQSGNADDPSCFEMQTVKVGDSVCFKSDFEQCGRITSIEIVRGWNGRPQVKLTLENSGGFGGEYLRYATKTVEDATDCWL
jgi:hypothetical protein